MPCALLLSSALLPGSVLLATPSAQQPGLQLVVRQAPEAAPPGPVWSTSFDEAVAAARQRHVLMLIYFTAKW